MARKKSDPLILALDEQVVAILEASKNPDVEFKERLLAFREGVRYLQVKNKVEIDEPEGGIHEFTKILNAGSSHRGKAPSVGSGGGRSGADGGGADSAPSIAAPPGPDFWAAPTGPDADDEGVGGEGASAAVADRGDGARRDGDALSDRPGDDGPGRLHGARRNGDGTLRPNWPPSLTGRGLS